MNEVAPVSLPHIKTQIGASDKLVRAACQEADMDGGAIQHVLSNAGLLNQGVIKQRNQAHSQLNACGAPVQTCLSYQLETQSSEVRFLIDPFFDEDTRQRHSKSFCLIEPACRALGRHGAFNYLRQNCEASSAGTFWLGGRLRPNCVTFSDGFAIYFNSETLHSLPIELLLSRFLPKNADRDSLLTKWLQFGWVVSFALELTPAPYPIRVKLYLRLNDPMPPQLLKLFDAGTAELVTRMLSPKGFWPATGVTYALAFNSQSGAPEGFKMDFCLCSTCRAMSGIHSHPEHVLEREVPNSRLMLKAGRLALLGFGQGGKGVRLNAYFEPML